MDQLTTITTVSTFVLLLKTLGLRSAKELKELEISDLRSLKQLLSNEKNKKTKHPDAPSDEEKWDARAQVRPGPHSFFQPSNAAEERQIAAPNDASYASHAQVSP